MFEVGYKVVFEKTFTVEDVLAFAEISLDDNPVHLDERYAQGTIFTGCIVHGILLSSMFSKIFGTIFPGNGTIYLSQSTRFIRPGYVGDHFRAEATLSEYIEEKRRGTFNTQIFDSKDQLIITGEAKLLFPEQVSDEKRN